MIALSSVSRLFSHRRLQVVVCRLGTSPGVPGPHAFAVTLRCRSSRDTWRPSHPASNVRDDAYAPHEEAGRRPDNHNFPKNVRIIFFLKAEILLDRSGKSSGCDILRRACVSADHATLIRPTALRLGSSGTTQKSKVGAFDIELIFFQNA
jgi:hypothetical protein